MAAISIFSYSVISSIVIGPLYITDQCDYLYECFGDLATMSLSGGFLGALSYSSLTQSQTAWAYIFTISFYIIISSVILNAVTGLIIDSFGAQRGEKEDNENEMANNCFICSLNRNEFSKYANEFEDHIQKDHYMWTYLEFLAYIREVDPTEYSDTESYIVKKVINHRVV